MVDHDYDYVSSTDETHDKVCSVGGETVTEEHDYVDGKCACGAEEPVEDLTDPELVAVGNIGLSAESLVGLQVAIDPAVAAKYDRVYLAVTHEKDEQGTLVEYTYECELLTLDGATYFQYGVAAKEMGDLLDLALFGVKDGKTYAGQTFEDQSVKVQLISRLDTYFAWYTYAADPYYKNICDLSANLLGYGAEAQKLFNYKKDTLMTDGVDARYLALIRTDDVELEALPTLDGSMTVKPYYYYLQLEKTIEASIMVYMGTTNYEGYRAVVTFEGQEYEARIDSYPGYAGYAYLIFDKMPAKDLREDFTMTVYNAKGVAVSPAWTFSIENFCAYKQADFPDMVKAIMHYSNAAKALFG